MTVTKSDLVNFIDFTLFSMTCAQILDYLVRKEKKENLPQARKFLRFVKQKLHIYLKFLRRPEVVASGNAKLTKFYNRDNFAN